MNRRERGLSENIYLVKLEFVSDVLIFHILGSSKHVYQVSLKINASPQCTCPDHKIRKRTCKHMYFVLERVLMKSVEQWDLVDDIQLIKLQVEDRLPHLSNENITSEEYTRKYENQLNVIKSGKVSDSIKQDEEDVNSHARDALRTDMRNEDCCVCLNEIAIRTQLSTVMCMVCKNAVHAVCWSKWKQINSDDKCVYCRSPMQSADQGKLKLKQNSFGMLLV